MDVVRVAEVRKRFGAAVALDGVSLAVGRGEIVAVLGPNGAGKTTLLRVLNRTVTPDSGSVLVASADETAPSQRGRVGIALGDERSWYLRLSGRRNLAFFATLEGLTGRRARDRIDAVLHLAELSAEADRPVAGYSSGMRARLAIARAVLAEPAALLLDEPSRSLEPLASVRFRDLVRDQARTGRAVLIATHDLHEAAAIADRVLVLHRGRVVAEVPDIGAGDGADRLERLLVDVTAS